MPPRRAEREMRLALLLLLCAAVFAAPPVTMKVRHHSLKNHTALDAVAEAMLALSKTMAAIERSLPPKLEDLLVTLPSRNSSLQAAP